MDHVLQALEAMYSPGVGQAQKKQATEYLEAFQKSPQAWEWAHQLLADVHSPLEYRMFASQTLRSKATYDLLQLPENSYADLKESMLGLLDVYASKDRLIRVQISLALCQLALQYLQWQNAMNDITLRLSKPELVPALLEFLKCLPEELTESNKTPLTDEEFNARTADLITDNVPQVLLLLQSLADLNSPHTSLILDCLNSWIKECPIEDVLRIDSLASLIFGSLISPATFDKATECVCSVIAETRDINNYHLIDALYQKLKQVHVFYSKDPELLSDPDIFNGLTRIYAGAGEAWHVLIAKSPEHFKPLVDILLQCCQYDGDLDVVKYTFYFWYQLKQMLTLPKFEQSRIAFTPIYLDLIRAIIKHLRYPLGGDDNNLFDGDREEEDKFSEFRYEMGDVLKDCCVVVGPQKALNIPFQEIQSLISRQDSQWQLLEAPLFSMRTMAKEVSTKEKKILPFIMQMLVQLPEHPKIRYATTLVLGRYTEWTAQNASFLEPQLTYIIKGLEASQHTDEQVIKATCQALMYFCQDCGLLLVQFLDQLYMIYERVQGSVGVAQSYPLVDGLSHVINKVPAPQQYAAAETFLWTTLQRIDSFGASGNESVDRLCDELEVVIIFVRISRCEDYSEAQFPLANFFMDKIWPVIMQVVSKAGNVLRVNECCSKALRLAINNCTSYLSPILPQVTEFLRQGFRSTYFGCYLYVTGIVIKCSEEFRGHEQQQAIFGLAMAQSETMLELFSTHTELELRELPDVVEDFFGMASDLLMFYPEEVMGNQTLTTSIFEAGLVALKSIQEFDPFMACVHYYIDYLSWGSEYPPVSFFEGDHESLKASVKGFMALNNNVDKLIKVVLDALIYKFHNDVDVNDLMIKILTVAPNQEQSVQSLKHAVECLPNVSEKEVHKLVSAIVVALPNKDMRRVRMSLRDFVSWYTRKNVNSRALTNK